VADRRALFAGGALLLLAACSVRDEDAAPEPAGEQIACATGGATALDQQCLVERERVEGTITLVIHHPDGGFRRLLVPQDGSPLVAADGADGAVIVPQGDALAVTLGSDRYLLPLDLASADGP